MKFLQPAYASLIYLIINFNFHFSRTLHTNKSRHKYGTNIRLKSIENKKLSKTKIAVSYYLTAIYYLFDALL